MSKTNLELAQELNTEADGHWYSDRYAQAEPFRRQALTLQEQELGPDSPELLDTLDGLAWILHEQGKFAEAEPLFRRSLELRKSNPQSTRNDVIHGIYQVAVSCHVQRKFGEAKALYEQALELHGANGHDARHIKYLYEKLLDDMKK